MKFERISNFFEKREEDKKEKIIIIFKDIFSEFGFEEDQWAVEVDSHGGIIFDFPISSNTGKITVQPEDKTIHFLILNSKNEYVAGGKDQTYSNKKKLIEKIRETLLPFRISKKTDES